MQQERGSHSPASNFFKDVSRAKRIIFLSMNGRDDRMLDIETVEDASLEAPTDVLMRITSSAICGTDLHIYEGRMGEVDGMVIGHEPLGIVEEVGSAVVSIRKGDRVVVPTHICCGFCYNCVRGYSSSCLTTNPGSVGAAYGYPGMGPYRGTQTEIAVVIMFEGGEHGRLAARLATQVIKAYVDKQRRTPTKMVEKPKVGGKVEIGGVWTAPDADGDREVLDGGRFLVSLPRKPLPIAIVAPGLH